MQAWELLVMPDFPKPAESLFILWIQTMFLHREHCQKCILS